MKFQLRVDTGWMASNNAKARQDIAGRVTCVTRKKLRPFCIQRTLDARVAVLELQKRCHFALGSPCEFAFPRNVEALWQGTMMGMT